MVRTKVTPWNAEVRPPKCIVYITRNPVTFDIQRHHHLFLLYQQVRQEQHQAAYKRHVHRPPAKPATTTTAENTAHNRCNQTSTIHRQ